MKSIFGKIPLCFLAALISLCSSVAQSVNKPGTVEKDKGLRTPARSARIVDFSVVKGGPLHISFSDRTDIEIPLERGRFGNLKQEAFEDVQLAEDGRHIGWLADYMICAQSYPCHAELVIYQVGKKPIYIPPPHGVIWDWQFVEGGNQVRVHSGFPHGDDTGVYTAYDAETGSEIRPASPNKKAPR